MAKLENTTANRGKVIVGTIGAGIILGTILRTILNKSHNTKYAFLPFIIGGALVGMMVAPNISDVIIKQS